MTGPETGTGRRAARIPGWLFAGVAAMVLAATGCRLFQSTAALKARGYVSLHTCAGLRPFQDTLLFAIGDGQRFGIINAARPDSPAWVRRNDSLNVQDIQFSGNIGYAVYWSTLYVYDFSNPMAVVRLDSFSLPQAQHVATGTGVLCVTSQESCHVFTLAQADPVRACAFALPGQGTRFVAADGNRLMVARYSSDYYKVLFYDLSSPAAPVLKGTLNFPFSNQLPGPGAFCGNTVLLGIPGRVMSYDVSNLAQPVFLDSSVKFRDMWMGLPDEDLVQVCEITSLGDIAVIRCDLCPSVVLLDISNPRNLRYLWPGEHDETQSSLTDALAVKSPYVYTAFYDDRIQVYQLER